MSRIWIKTGIATGLLTASVLHAEILYERDGIALEGSVRMAGRNAATCQVLAENESPEAYEAAKAHHGRPLHVWRVDYSAFNGSGKPLSQITAHFRVQSEWPPCTNWTGLARYPGPVQWAGSFETLQRAGGLEPGGEASATLYVLAIDGQQPRFANWQVDFRFGEATATAEAPLPLVASPPEPEPPRALAPLCEEREGERDCWKPLPEPPGCHFWNPGFHPDFAVTWTGGCEDGVATGPGILAWDTGEHSEDRFKVEARGSLRGGKQHGDWVERWDPRGILFPSTEEGPYVDGNRHGHWVERIDNGNVHEGPYVDGLMHGRWVFRYADGDGYTATYDRGRQVN